MLSMCQVSLVIAYITHLFYLGFYSTFLSFKDTKSAAINIFRNFLFSI